MHGRASEAFAPESSGSLIDAYLPSFQVREYHETRVRAEPAAAYAAFLSLDLNRSRFVRLLFAIRTLPSRVLARGPRSKTPPRSFLEDALAVGWRVLAEEPGREIVVGAVTQPWAPVVRFRGLPGAEFLSFGEPGFTKIAWNFAVRPEGPGWTRISTETRVAATDPVSQRRFRRYWLLVRAGVRLIRIISLRMLRRDLEARRRESASTR